MRSITVELPERPLDDDLTDAELSQEILMLAAVKLFELGRVSSGRAAELAGVSRLEFLEHLGRYGVSAFQITPEELRAEAEGLRADLGK